MTRWQGVLFFVGVSVVGGFLVLVVFWRRVFFLVVKGLGLFLHACPTAR